MHKSLFSRTRDLLCNCPYYVGQVTLGLALTLTALKVADDKSLPATIIHHVMINLSVIGGAALISDGATHILID